MTLAIGQMAPDFTLPTDTAGNVVHLQALRGHRVLLYFYPKDNTPGCTQQACDFRDHFSTFQQKSVIVLGISKDTAQKHTQFKKKYQLPFTLLTDANGEVCIDYGVIHPKSMFGKTFLAIQRSTFLINENGVIERIWRKVKVSGHVEQIIDECF